MGPRGKKPYAMFMKQRDSSFPVPQWFSRLSHLGLAVLRPFLPAAWLKWLEHMAWFVAVGGFNTLASYLIFCLAVEGVGLGRGLSLFIGYGLGMLIAYQNFSRFVFSGANGRAWLRFAPAYVVLFLANWGLLVGLMWLSGWGEVLVQFLLLPVVAALSYLLNRFFVFRG